MIIGTCHFISLTSARKYYAPYLGTTWDKVKDRARIAEWVSEKIKNGEIKIGAPSIKRGQKLIIVDDGTRYAIEEQTP